MLEYSMGPKNFIFWKYAISAFKRRVWCPFMIIRKKKGRTLKKNIAKTLAWRTFWHARLYMLVKITIFAKNPP